MLVDDVSDYKIGFTHAGVPNTNNPLNGLMKLIQLFRILSFKLYLADRLTEYSFSSRRSSPGKGFAFVVEDVFFAGSV